MILRNINSKFYTFINIAPFLLLLLLYHISKHSHIKYLYISFTLFMQFQRFYYYYFILLLFYHFYFFLILLFIGQKLSHCDTFPYLIFVSLRDNYLLGQLFSVSMTQFLFWGHLSLPKKKKGAQESRPLRIVKLAASSVYY